MATDTAKDLLENYRAKGITIWLDGEKLRYKAKKAALSGTDLERLKEQKDTIINYLKAGQEVPVLTVDRQNRYDVFPMTDVQSAYLLGRQKTFEYGGVACHVYLEISYERLDIRPLKQVWNTLVQRHEMLRTLVYENGYQQIQETVPELKIPCYDLRESADADQQLADIRKAMGHRVYELGAWPMFGLALTEQAAGSILHFSMEFLIADWTSIWMLLAEFEQLYFEPGKELPEFGLSFRDYVMAERKFRQTAAYEQDKKYWLEKIAQFPEAPKLPGKRRPDIGDKPSFERQMLVLEPARWERLKGSAARLGITPTAAVLAAYCAVLRRWSSNKRFCINMTVLNRMPLHPEINQVMGDFTTINLLAAEAMPGMTFAEQAKGLNRTLFDDLDHRLYSGIEVLRELSRQGRESFMPIVFTSAIGLIGGQNQLRGRFDGFGITQTPQVFIDCQAMDGAFGLQVNWDIRAGVFPDGLIADMFAAFEQLLNRLADEPDSVAAEPKIELPKYQQELRRLVNNTQKELFQGLLYERFDQAAARWPKRLAVTDGRVSFTYAGLRTQALAIAAEIGRQGGKVNDRIPVIMEKNSYQVAAVLGVLYMGGVYVPIEAGQAVRRTEAIVCGANAPVVLVHSGHPYEGDSQAAVIVVDQLATATKTMAGMEPVRKSPDEAAYIIYTSGSTGTPKGVVISHRAALNTIEDINGRFNLGPEDAVLGLSKLNFDLSVYDIFGLLSVGGRIIYPEREQYLDASHWLELIDEHRITVWNSVPALMGMLLTAAEGNRKNGASLRLALLSGDWIPLAMPAQIRERFPLAEVISLGGATEAAIWSICHPCQELQADWVSIPYGKPLDNQTIHVLDDNLAECPLWTAGEILIGGTGLADEYYGDPELTAARFITHPVNGRLYRTGDLGRYLPDGTIEFLGRQDNQVKIKGHRIELGEIEAAFSSYDDVKGAAALADPAKHEIVLFAEARRLDAAERQQAAAAAEQMTQGIDQHAEGLVRGLDLAAIADFCKVRDTACAVSILHGFQRLGFFEPGNNWNREQIQRSGIIDRKLDWLIQPYINCMAAQGLLTQAEGGWQAQNLITNAELERQWQRTFESWYEPLGDVKILEYLKLNAGHFAGVLTGETDPLGLLYPDGNTDYPQALYGDNLMATYLNLCIARMVKRLAEEHQGETLRILEVGAGTGSTTVHVLKYLEGCDNYEYYFTDETKYFFSDAEKKFGHNHKVVRKALNLDRDYREQGFEPNSFDVVIGAYVLENTRDVKHTLEQLRQMLKPQGYLLFSTPRSDLSWLMVSQAAMMAEPADSLRQESAFVSTASWRQLLDSGEEPPYYRRFPAADGPLAVLGLQLFAVQFKQDVKRLAAGTLKSYAGERLPDYMMPTQIYQVDQLPLTANGKTDRRQLKQWQQQMETQPELSETGAQPETELQKQLVAAWSRVLNVESIGVKQNFYDFGADSLVMAQAAAEIRKQAAGDIPFESLLRQMLNHPTVLELEQFIIGQGPSGRADAEAAVSSEAEPPAPETDFAYVKSFGGSGERKRILLHGGFGAIENFNYLGPALAAQNLGEVCGIGICDMDAYSQIDAGGILELLVGKYTNMILDMQPDRVQLIGYCYSGTLAVEIARRLAEQGIEVDDLAVIDGGAMPVTIRQDFMSELLFVNMVGIPLTDLGFTDEKILERVLWQVVEDQKQVVEVSDVEEKYRLENNGREPEPIFYQLKGMTQTGRFEVYRQFHCRNTGRQTDTASLLRMFRTFQQSFHMYVLPELYFGNIRFYTAKIKEGIFQYFNVMLERWREICMGEFQVEEIEGDHFTCIEVEEHAVRLAALLSQGCENTK